MLFVHFIGLAMALGGGFSNQFLGYAASKMPRPERGAFMGKVMILMQMGRIGLLLLVLSGIYLMGPFWSGLGDMPFLQVKLVLVALLVINVIVATMLVNQARKANDPARMARLRPLGMINVGLAIVIVLMAVLAFH